MNEFVRVAIFVVIGFWNTALDFVIFWVLIRLFKKTAWPEKLFLTRASIAHTLSFIIANTQSYFLNRTFTFGDSESDRGFGLYFLVSVITLSITVVWIQLLTIPVTMRLKDKFFAVVGRYLPFLKKYLTDENWMLLSKLSGSAISMITNFVGYRFVVFV
jgi:putative flippase GtrA